MAEAIRIAATLDKDGVLPKPAKYAYAVPDLLAFHDAPMVIERKFFGMFLEHRMWAFQGIFHASSHYARRYACREMQRDLAEIKELAPQIRRKMRCLPGVGGSIGGRYIASPCDVCPSAYGP